MPGCGTVAKPRGKNGQSIGSVAKACRTWEKSRGKIEEWKNLEEALSRLKECDLDKATRLYKGKTGVGWDGSHTKRTRREIVDLLGRVEQSGKWPQQACTTMFSLIPKNVTSERPIALMPTLMRWWEAMRVSEVSK